MKIICFKSEELSQKVVSFNILVVPRETLIIHTSCSVYTWFKAYFWTVHTADAASACASLWIQCSVLAHWGISSVSSCCVFVYLLGVRVDDSGSLGCHLLWAVPHQRQVVAAAEGLLQEEWGAAAAQLAVRDDGDAVAQNVCLVHVVRGQKDGVIWGEAEMGSVSPKGQQWEEGEEEEERLCVSHPRLDVGNKQAEYKKNIKLGLKIMK